MAKENDLISREALQKIFESECVGECGCCKHIRHNPEGCALIDNAPAISDEELEAEVERRGIDCKQKPEKINFLPCVCGANRRTEWYTQSPGYIYECQKCGICAPEGRTKKAAKINWNTMIEQMRRQEGAANEP